MPADVALNFDSSTHRWLFVVAQLDSAAAMIVSARVSHDPKEVRRQAEGAREAYEAALKIFIGTALSEDQEREIWARVAPIREWLESKGLLNR